MTEDKDEGAFQARPLTEAELDSLEKLLSEGAAVPWKSPAPWGPEDGRPYCCLESLHEMGEHGGHVGNVFAPANTLLVLGAVNSLPALLAEIRMLREEKAAMLNTLEWWEAHGNGRRPP